MATTLFMQPVACLIVSALILILLATLGRYSGLREEQDHAKAALVVDKLWRYIVGFGGIPALITAILRAGMPESPLYTLDISDSGPLTQFQDEETGLFSRGRDPGQVIKNLIRWGYSTAIRFLQAIGNWRHLAGISICAFILNAAIGSLGADNYRVLAETWDFSPTQSNATSLYAWSDGQNGSAGIGDAIYSVLFDMSLHSIFTFSISSVVGALILIRIVDHCPRGALLRFPSLALAVLFAVLASISLLTTPITINTAKTVMVVFCYWIFNIGSLSHLRHR
jgi:MFS transporter, PHS family, inorganic phosphate transporter